VINNYNYNYNINLYSAALAYSAVSDNETVNIS